MNQCNPRALWRSLMLATALTAATVVPAVAAPPPLSAYNADIAQTSISGISSGAYMAVQFATAWSSIVKGVGAIAGGPFGCSEGTASEALSTCEGGEPPPDLSELIRRPTHGARVAGWTTSHIAAQKVYLFHGSTTPWCPGR